LQPDAPALHMLSIKDGIFVFVAKMPPFPINELFVNLFPRLHISPSGVYL
jgi:hypothetical protein